MNETESGTRANRIDPILREAGWGVVEDWKAVSGTISGIFLTSPKDEGR